MGLDHVHDSEAEKKELSVEVLSVSREFEQESSGISAADYLDLLEGANRYICVRGHLRAEAEPPALHREP